MLASLFRLLFTLLEEKCLDVCLILEQFSHDLRHIYRRCRTSRRLILYGITLIIRVEIRISIPDTYIITESSRALLCVLHRIAIKIVVKDKHISTLSNRKTLFDRSRLERTHREFLPLLDNGRHHILYSNTTALQLLMRKGFLYLRFLLFHLSLADSSLRSDRDTCHSCYPLDAFHIVSLNVETLQICVCFEWSGEPLLTHPALGIVIFTLV